MWPGYFKDELHIGYVTNGVHFFTWCAANLQRLYAKYFPEGFSLPDYSIPAWQKVHEIPDSELWAERLVLKNKLIAHVKKRVSDPAHFRFDSPVQLIRIHESLKPDVLTIGFARRFATYKRAHLLFTNLDRLDAIVNNPERPVQFLFAGKAHPNDKPGQDLIKRIVEVAAMPRFAGKVIFLQNYDMELARRMVQGVDIWLNTPTRPLEASGTSGEKAVMNGTMHFSVLDGWWVEGYHEGGGWKLPMERTFEDQNFQNELDAELIYTTIENDIVPKYYNRGTDNVPHEWVEAIKVCLADIAPNFTTNRMLTDYQERFYGKLYERNTHMRADDFRMAREIAAWKRKVSNAWDKVRIVSAQRIDMGKEAILIGALLQRRGGGRHRRAESGRHRRGNDHGRPDRRRQQRQGGRQARTEARTSGGLAGLLPHRFDARHDRVVRPRDPGLPEERETAAPHGLRAGEMGITLRARVQTPRTPLKANGSQTTHTNRWNAEIGKRHTPKNTTG